MFTIPHIKGYQRYGNQLKSNTKLKRVTPKSYSDFIHNSEELTQFLINNGYKQYIDY